MTEPIDAFQMGAATLPLDATATGTLVRTADPALYHLAAFLKWGLERHVGARLAAEATSAGASGITAAVTHVTWRDPAPLLTSEQVPLPLLALYRKNAEIAEHTKVRARELTKLELLYVLPPFDAGRLERLSPILLAAARVVLNFSRELIHAAYTPPGGTLGQDVRAVSGINYAAVTGYRFGDVAGFARGLYMPAVMVSLDMSEVETVNETAVDALAGTDNYESVYDATLDTTLSNVVQTLT